MALVFNLFIGRICFICVRSTFKSLTHTQSRCGQFSRRSEWTCGNWHSPKSSNFSSRWESLLSRRSCLSISLCILSFSSSSTDRQHSPIFSLKLYQQLSFKLRHSWRGLVKWMDGDFFLWVLPVKLVSRNRWVGDFLQSFFLLQDPVQVHFTFLLRSGGGWMGRLSLKGNLLTDPCSHGPRNLCAQCV